MARKKTALKGFLREVETARAESGRNTLAAWFRTHHDELLAELAGRPIEWDLYLAVFAKRGLKDADGNTPTRTTASKTWHRVRAAIKTERARKQSQAASAAKLAPDEIAPGVRHLEPAHAAQAAPAQEPAHPRMKLDIRPARPLADVSAEGRPAPALLSREEAAHPADVQEQIRRVLDALDEKRTPMPRIIR